MADSIPRFGASDFWLVQIDAAQLREQLRSALEAVLGRPVIDADPHMVLASAFLPFLVQGQASADACAKATLRAYAVGQDLDRIADSTCVVGYLDRLPARGAVLSYILNGTLMRQTAADVGSCRVSWTARRVVQIGGTEVVFSGSGSAEVSLAATEATKVVHIPAYLVCEIPGSAYNGVFPEYYPPIPETDSELAVEVSVSASEGTTDEYTISGVSGLRCGTAYNGSDEEDDQSFAQRVAWQAKALRVSGSVEYFRLALSTLHLLADAYVSPDVDEEGRIIFVWCDKPDFYAKRAGISLSTRGAAYDEFYTTVKGSLLIEQRGYVYPATWDFAKSWGVVYRLPQDTADIQTARGAVESAWAAYVSQHAWRCGAVISTSDMIRALSDAGAATVSVLAGSTTTLPADYIVIDSAFALTYQGLSTDSLPPLGGEGEEVVP